MLKNPAVSEHKCFLQSTVHNIQRHLSCKIDTFFARHAAARQRQWRRLLLNLWRNFDGGSLASTPVWMIYTLILQSCTLSFVNFLSKIWFFLQSSRTARKWNQFLSTAVCENWSLLTAPLVDYLINSIYYLAQVINGKNYPI